jgi:Zn-dependent protease with chaperone function
MTALLLAAALLALLGAGAMVGPRALDGLAPAFSTRPRLGMAIWTISAAVWTLAFLALGPLLTWSFTSAGLPGQVGAVCRRCLAAANPLSGLSPMWTTDVPALAMLLIPASLAAGVVAAAIVRRARSRAHLRAHVNALALVAEQRVLAGTRVWLTPSTDRTVYSLPTRGVRVVVSQGALDVLSPDQVTAVLSHECTHIRQRHHLMLWALRSLRDVLRLVPLIAAAAPAVAALAEMAADDSARRASGTRALAGALLALHGAGSGSGLGATELALHADAPGAGVRIRRLAGGSPAASRRLAAATGAYLVAMTAAIALIVTPYASLALKGTC